MDGAYLPSFPSPKTIQPRIAWAEIVYVMLGPAGGLGLGLGLALELAAGLPPALGLGLPPAVGLAPVLGLGLAPALGLGLAPVLGLGLAGAPLHVRFTSTAILWASAIASRASWLPICGGRVL
jgi:hypothetical protein